MYKTLDKLQSQARLPRRTNTKKDVFENFSVVETSAEEFIEEEKKRLIIPKSTQKIAETTEVTKDAEEAYVPSNRPQKQKSLTEFYT